MHVIGQEGCGSIVDPISYHHGYKVARCADGVEGRGSTREMLVSRVRGDPEQQTWCHLQRCQACISCVVSKYKFYILLFGNIKVHIPQLYPTFCS